VLPAHMPCRRVLVFTVLFVAIGVLMCTISFVLTSVSAQFGLSFIARPTAPSGESPSFVDAASSPVEGHLIGAAQARHDPCSQERVAKNELKKGERCFCLFTGHCQDQFHCKGLSLPECQRIFCQGRHPLEVTEVAASFTNMKDEADILTIPVTYYRDLAVLKTCRPDADVFLASLLEAGRRVYIGNDAGGPGKHPTWQCIHLPRTVSVRWLHLHTFTGYVPGEALPARPPNAVCANATMGVWDAAHQMLMRSPGLW